MEEANFFSFRTVIILHIAGVIVMIIGSEVSRSWTSTLTEQDLSRVKQLLEDVSSSPWTLIFVGLVPVLIRLALFCRSNNDASKEIRQKDS